jgi:pantoate--beta-alanine ligase
MASTYRDGESEVAALMEVGHRVMATEPNVRIDYLAIVDADTLLPLLKAVPGTLVAVAAHVGNTRLIDNLIL